MKLLEFFSAITESADASVTIQYRGQPKVAVKPRRARNEILMTIPTQAMDAAFKRDGESFYVGPGGSGASIGDRYSRFQNWIEENEQYEVPEVYVNDEGRMSFANGRHRYAVLRDAGVDPMPVAMSQEGVRNAQQLLKARIAESIVDEIKGYEFDDEESNAEGTVDLFKGHGKKLKPFGRLPSGIRMVYVPSLTSVKHKGNKDIFFIPKGKRNTIGMATVAFPEKGAVMVEYIMLAPEVQGAGIGLEFYKYWLDQGYTIHSDEEQTTKATALWRKLIGEYEAVVLRRANQEIARTPLTSYTEFESLYDGSYLTSIELLPKLRTVPLTEAPVRNMNVGDLDAPYSTFSATDRAMLQSPKAADVARKRIKTAIPIDINIYTIPGGAPWQKDTDTVYGKAPMQDYSDTSYNQALFNRQLERWSGVMRSDDAEEIIGQPIEVNKDSVNVLYLSNANKITSIPLTPWMMMHRLGHSLEDAARKGHLGGNASEALDDLFGFYTRRMGYMYGASLRQVMTTKAGRDETINDGDTVSELIAQYLHSGRIRLIRPVSYEPTGDEDVAHKFTLSNGKTMFVKGDELDGGDPMKAFTNKLEADERSIAEHISEIVRYAIGLLVVAP